MFHKCKSKEEVKSLYFKLAQFLHPDKGGDGNLFSLLKESYDMALEFVEVVKMEKKNKRRYENTVYDVDFTDIESLKIIDDIYEYAKTHPKFKTDYLDSIVEYLKQNNYITSHQFNSLVKVYYAFRMEKEL